MVQLNAPLVTVAVSSYNCANYITQTLDSIKAQSYPNIQLIIVDDASADHSVSLIQDWINTEFRSATFIKNEKNEGVCSVFQKALNLAEGKYFSFIGSDDIMCPEKIASQVEIMEKSSSKVGVIFSDSFLIKENGDIHFGRYIQRFRQLEELPSGNIYNLLAQGNFIPAHAALTKTAIIREVGGFDLSLSFEDWDLWLRIAKNYEFIFTDKPTVYYRIRKSSLMQSGQIRHSGDSLRVLLKHMDNEFAQRKYYEILTYYFLSNYKIFKKHIPNINKYFRNSGLFFIAKFRVVLRPLYLIFHSAKSKLLKMQ